MSTAATYLDFELLFENAPGLFLVLRPEPTFAILAASDAYLQATFTERETITGRPLFEVFPDNPNDPEATGTRNLGASLRRVLTERTADAMSVQKYDIRRPLSAGGGFEERFWSPVNSPVLSVTGELLYIIHRVEDVTAFVRVSRTNEAMELEVLLRSRELDAANEQLRKASAEALNKSEARLATVLENISEGVAVADLTGHMLHFNGAAVRIHGFTDPREYMIDLPEFAQTFDFVALDGTVVPPEQWALTRILHGETLWDWVVTIRRLKSDWQRIFSYGGTLARDANGEPMMAVLTIRDITEQKQSEHKIQRQLECLNLLDHVTRSIGERQDLPSIFQVVIGSLEDGLATDFACVCLYDESAHALKVVCVGTKSAALAAGLMTSDQALIDIDANGLSRCIQGELVYEPNIDQVQFSFPRTIARGGLRSLVMAPLRSEDRVFGVLVAARREAFGFSSVECEFLRQLCEHVALATRQAQLYGALQQAYDDLRETQRAAMQHERLSALGQMASGISHDINNALSPVSLYAASLLENEPGLSARARNYLVTIQRAVDDVTQTIGRMREFYRQRERQIELSPVQINQMMQQVLDLTRARWNDMPQQRGIVIRQRLELALNLPQIMGVESEIREALVNLIFNAVDAMPQGGTLTLRTRLVDPVARSAPAAVIVEVVDQGFGMDEETRGRCLEPFFTTKGERGTGLGLAMVFGMVQRHSAEIEIESEPGKGTTMRLIFSASEAAVVGPEQSLRRAAPPPPQRVLIVDDDPLLLKSLRDTLETDGHMVVAATGGEAGIEAFQTAQRRGEPFDVVITDLGMPHVDGRMVADAVKAASPSTPVILLTGWGQRLIESGDQPTNVNRVLSKPPKLRDLREALLLQCGQTLLLPTEK